MEQRRDPEATEAGARGNRGGSQMEQSRDPEATEALARGNKGGSQMEQRCFPNHSVRPTPGITDLSYYEWLCWRRKTCLQHFPIVISFAEL